MNKEENLIIWQKWFDPFGDDEELHDFDTSPMDEPEDISPFDQKPMKAIATPMGIIPYTENTASSKIFNFWIGHTNFNITQNVSDVIEKTDGVETLDVFTRYRFRIAIGKSFDESKVKTDINNRVYQILSYG